MKPEVLQKSLELYRELQGVLHTIKSMEKGEVRVRVEYRDKNKGCSTDERTNYFNPHSSYFLSFLEGYKDSLMEKLQENGLEL